MPMTRQIFMSGDSFCMTIPKDMAKVLGLKRKTTVEVRYDPATKSLRIYNLTRALETGRMVPAMTEGEKQYDLSVQG
jgi:antitoxin component of MazEF toxin-antitoxin module